MRITGKPKSPIEFLDIVKTEENIRQYYQESLGPKLTSANEVGSVLAERVLYHLHRYVPNRLPELRRKYFVPGMPANVALMCVISAIRQQRYIQVDVMQLCEDVPEAIAMNRVIAMALAYNLALDRTNDFDLAGAFPPETIGLMDCVRRNMALIRSTGLSITPISDVDPDLVRTVFERMNFIKEHGG